MDFLSSEQLAAGFQTVLQTPFALQTYLYYVIFGSFIVSQLTYVVTHWYFSRHTFYGKLPLLEQIEFQSRVVSTMHGTTVFPMVLYVLLTDAEYHADPVHGKSDISNVAMAFGVGYFFSDFILIVRYNIQPLWPIICHHVFAGWGFLIAIGDHGGGRWFGTYLLLTEATSPFNNTHWSLTKAGMKESRITKLIGYGFTLNWIIFRLAINPYLVYRIYYFWNELVASGPYIFLVLMTNCVFLVLMNNVFFITGPFREIVFGEKKVDTNADSIETTTIEKNQRGTRRKSNTKSVHLLNSQ